MIKLAKSGILLPTGLGFGHFGTLEHILKHKKREIPGPEEGFGALLKKG